jgi:CheY-like chemotaxis protein
VKESDPDLIVLDVMMPKRTGFVLFKQLRKDEKYKHIPVIMLTAVSGMLEEQEAAREDTFEKPYESLRQSLSHKISDMRDEGLEKPEMFVDKPIDPEEFVLKVKELIGD